MVSPGARQLDHPLVVLRCSSCKQTRITKAISVRCYDLGAEYSEMNHGSNAVSRQPITPGMVEFWASTGGHMTEYASC